MKTSKTEEPVTALRFCNMCKRSTEHEAYAGDGCTAYICIPCRRQSEIQEHTRE
jgi:hypothetical protein